jgi:hypothetical protein
MSDGTLRFRSGRVFGAPLPESCLRMLRFGRSPRPWQGVPPNWHSRWHESGGMLTVLREHVHGDETASERFCFVGHVITRRHAHAERWAWHPCATPRRFTSRLIFADGERTLIARAALQRALATGQANVFLLDAFSLDTGLSKSVKESEPCKRSWVDLC